MRGMLEVEQLSFAYAGRQVLTDISFSAAQGELLSILGANGTGKSTLFKCILNLLPDYEGSVRVDGTVLRGMRAGELARKIAYIPQVSASAFNYSVEEIVLMGATASLGLLRSPGKKERAAAENAMQRVGIEQLRNRCFHHLSGGEKQLAILARALTQESRILLLDEPVSALDYGNQMKILSLAKSLASEDYTVVQTTHDPEKAFMFSDRIVALQNGRIFKMGTPKDVLDEDCMHALYNVDTDVKSIYDDRVRVFTPKSMAESE